jgi:hypothetical protein
MLSQKIEIVTATLGELDFMCASYLATDGLKDPRLVWNNGDGKVWAHKVGMNRKGVINIASWYSPTRKWEDAGPIIEEFLKSNGLPNNCWTLPDIIRHMLVSEHGSSLDLPLT